MHAVWCPACGNAQLQLTKVHGYRISHKGSFFCSVVITKEMAPACLRILTGTTAAGVDDEIWVLLLKEHMHAAGLHVMFMQTLTKVFHTPCTGHCMCYVCSFSAAAELLQHAIKLQSCLLCHKCISTVTFQHVMFLNPAGMGRV